MQRSVDLVQLQSVDAALLIEYLTAAASACAETAAFHVADLTDLRVSVLSLDSFGGQSMPSLGQLRGDSGADFVEFLINRYGEASLSLNLLRMALRDQLGRTRLTLNELGQALLTKTNLLFNRPFFVQSGGVALKRTFYSTVLVEIASAVADISGELERIVGELQLMIPHAGAHGNPVDELLDAKLAERLGFRGVTHRVMPLIGDKRLLRRIAEQFLGLAEHLSDVLHQVRFNLPLAGSNRLPMLCESMLGEVARYLTFKMPEEASLDAWDHYRHAITGCVLTFNENLSQLSSALLELITMPEQTTPFSVVFAVAAKRRLVGTLMTRGVSAVDAKAATAALIHYCENHGVNPRQVLAGELTKVHPCLDQAALDALASAVPDKAISSGSADEKDRAFHESSRLTKIFASWQSQLSALLVFLAVTLITACGVKTAPKSDVDDFRPEIPFRGPPLRSPATPPEDKNAKDKP